MSEARNEIRMDVMDVFTHFERLGEETGVMVHIADHGLETGRRGFGIGMHGAQKRFLQHPGPALVLGLESKEALAKQHSFEAFLGLPCVRYLELPFTHDEFQQAAESARGVKVSKADLEEVQRSVTENVLYEISNNVIHKLCGMPLITLHIAVMECRNLAKKADFPLNASGSLTVNATSLASLDKNVQDALATLDLKISALDGICSKKISKVFCVQRNQLRKAAEDFTQFAEGITAWTRGELEPGSIEQLVNVGAEVERVFKEARSALTRLSEGRRNL